MTKKITTTEQLHAHLEELQHDHERPHAVRKFKERMGVPKWKLYYGDCSPQELAELRHQVRKEWFQCTTSHIGVLDRQLVALDEMLAERGLSPAGTPLEQADA